MTDEELEAVEKACAEATPGPWERKHMKGLLLGNSQVIGPAESRSRNEWVAEIDAAPSPQVLADGDFIANARSWVPALVSEVRRLRAHIEVCAKRLDEVDNYQPGRELDEISAELVAGIHARGGK